MAVFALENGRLVPAHSVDVADSGVVEESLTAIRERVLDLIDASLFPVAWQSEPAADQREGQRESLICLDATGQTVTVEVLGVLDATELLGSLARAGRHGEMSRSSLALIYGQGARSFPRDWRTFLDACPPGAAPGPRLYLIVLEIEPGVRSAVDALAGAGLDVRLATLHDGGTQVFVSFEEVRTQGSRLDSLLGSGTFDMQGIVASLPAEDEYDEYAVLSGDDGAAGDQSVDGGTEAGGTSDDSADPAPPERGDPAPVDDADPVSAESVDLASAEDADLADSTPEETQSPAAESEAVAAERETTPLERPEQAVGGSVDVLAESYAADAGTAEANAPESESAGTAGSNPGASADAGATAAPAETPVAEPSETSETATNVAGVSPREATRAGEDAPENGTPESPVVVSPSFESVELAESSRSATSAQSAHSSEAAAQSAPTPDLPAAAATGLSSPARPGAARSALGYDEFRFAPVSVPVAQPADSADSALTADEAASDRELLGTARQASAEASRQQGAQEDKPAPVRRRSNARREALQARTLRDMLMGDDAVQPEQQGENVTREKNATESGPEHPVRLDAPHAPRHRAPAGMVPEGANPLSRVDGYEGPSAYAQSAYEREQSRRRAEQLLWENSAPRTEEAARRSRLISESSAATFSSEAVAEAAEEDMASPAGRLIAIAQRHGAPFTVVWRQRRRNINLKARVTPWGTIVLSDGRVFTDPTVAARSASGIESADGWRVWRIPGGKRLGDL